MKRYNYNTFEAVFWILGFVFLAYVLLPLIAMLEILLFEGWSIVWKSELTQAMLVSFLAATMTTFLAAIFGIPLAYHLSRKEFWGKNLISNLILVPIVLPPMMSGILLLLIFSPRSPLGFLGIPQTLWGIISAQFFIASSFTVIGATAAFESVDSQLEKVARVLGRTKSETFFLVTFPLAWKGILAGLILTWLRAMGELGATMMMAYNPHTISIQLWEDNAIYGLEGILGTVSIVVLFTLFLLMTAGVIRRDLHIEIWGKTKK